MGYDAVECGTASAQEPEAQTIADRPSWPRRLKRAAVVLVAVMGIAGAVRVARRSAVPPVAELRASSAADVSSAAEVFSADVCTHCQGSSKCVEFLTEKDCLHDGVGCTWEPNRCGTEDDDDDSVSSYSYSYGMSDAMLI